ncbi:MAG: hypothetical protein ACRDXB_02255 [Actinomycetes bacterium]
MSTEDTGPQPQAPVDRLDESNASQARLAPRRRRAGDEYRDPRSGGDAAKAPTSLSAAELHPIECASSGISWDDPDEL